MHDYTHLKRVVLVKYLFKKIFLSFDIKNIKMAHPVLDYTNIRLNNFSFNNISNRFFIQSNQRKNNNSVKF